MQGAAVPSIEALGVVKDAGTLEGAGLEVALVVLLGPAVGVPLVVALPLRRSQLVHDGADTLGIVLVCEVRTERAASCIGTCLVDPRAPGAEDAGPARRQPREIAAEHLGVV